MKPTKRSRSCLLVLIGILVWVLGVVLWWSPVFYVGLAVIAIGVIIGFADTVRSIDHGIRTIVDKIRSKPSDTESPRSGGWVGMLAGIGILTLFAYIVITFSSKIIEWISQAIDAFLKGGIF